MGCIGKTLSETLTICWTRSVSKLAKKKETDPIEEPKKAQEEKAAESTKTAENEIPESVTLTRDEFLQVKERIDKLEKEKESDVALLQGFRRTLTTTAGATPQ